MLLLKLTDTEMYSIKSSASKVNYSKTKALIVCEEDSPKLKKGKNTKWTPGCLQPRYKKQFKISPADLLRPCSAKVPCRPHRAQGTEWLHKVSAGISLKD